MTLRNVEIEVFIRSIYYERIVVIHNFSALLLHRNRNFYIDMHLNNDNCLEIEERNRFSYKSDLVTVLISWGSSDNNTLGPE